MNPLFVIDAFLFGLVFGSFLNVLIYRLPRDLSIARGRSLCPHCGHTLCAADLVPLGSWLFLRAKCRYCRAPISPVYPAVELANALLWAAVAVRSGLTAEAGAFAAVCSCLLVVAFVDWQHMLIPDSLNVVIAAAGLVLLLFSARLSLADRLIGAVCVSGALLLISLVSGGRAMGGGDIKLTAALGLCLGWKLTVLTTLLGAVLGTLLMLLLRRTRWALGRQVPFGTFLAAAGIVVILYGNELLAWYLGLLSL